MDDLFWLLTLVSVAVADLIPTAPGPGELFSVGSECKMAWIPDASATWTNVTIDLMSGSNTRMTNVVNVISGLDGTDTSKTSFSWPCPDVDLYAAVYFYQFTNNLQTGVSPQWTTRFTILSRSGESSPAPSAAQPDGSPIPWGEGHLVQNAQALSVSSVQTLHPQPISAASIDSLDTIEVISAATLADPPATTALTSSRFSTVYATSTPGGSPTLGLPGNVAMAKETGDTAMSGGASSSTATRMRACWIATLLIVLLVM